MLLQQANAFCTRIWSFPVSKALAQIRVHCQVSLEPGNAGSSALSREIPLPYSRGKLGVGGLRGRGSHVAGFPRQALELWPGLWRAPSSISPRLGSLRRGPHRQCLLTPFQALCPHSTAPCPLASPVGPPSPHGTIAGPPWSLFALLCHRWAKPGVRKSVLSPRGNGHPHLQWTLLLGTLWAGPRACFV